MRRTAILLLALAAVGLLPSAAAAAGPGCERLRQTLVRGGGEASGLLIADARTGRRICGRAARRSRPLASNMKLFTTATALGRFGPNHRIPTLLRADRRPDRRGVVRGNLYLTGGGDPALGSPAFYGDGPGTNIFALRAKLRTAGVRRVTGRLYADDTIFDRRRGVADSGYATSPYIGPLSGLAFNYGYSSSSGGSFASDPAMVAARKLARSLRAAGIAVGGVSRRGAPARARILAAVRSPTMRQLADATNVPSNNFFAEMLMKLIGARFGGAGTTEAGARVVERYARSRGSGVDAVDGSGLTRSNSASPAQVVNLLISLSKGRLADPFIQSLPLAGREGTVGSRMDGTAAAGRCRVKTGTLTGVSSLSGYCFNRSGRVFAFSILMGGVYDTYSAHRAQDAIAATIAKL